MMLDKNEAKNDMFVFRGVHIATELVGSKPELLLKADIRRILLG